MINTEAVWAGATCQSALRARRRAKFLMGRPAKPTCSKIGPVRPILVRIPIYRANFACRGAQANQNGGKWAARAHWRATVATPKPSKMKQNRPRASDDEPDSCMTTNIPARRRATLAKLSAGMRTGHNATKLGARVHVDEQIPVGGPRRGLGRATRGRMAVAQTRVLRAGAARGEGATRREAWPWARQKCAMPAVGQGPRDGERHHLPRGCVAMAAASGIAVRWWRRRQLWLQSGNCVNVSGSKRRRWQRAAAWLRGVGGFVCGGRRGRRNLSFGQCARPLRDESRR